MATTTNKVADFSAWSSVKTVPIAGSPLFPAGRSLSRVAAVAAEVEAATLFQGIAVGRCFHRFGEMPLNYLLPKDMS